MLTIKPDTKAAYQLLHDGALVLAEIERTGIRIDRDYCERQQRLLGRRITRTTEQLMDDVDVQEWRRLKGQDFNINSNPQLSWYLFKHKGLEPIKETAAGNAQVDDEVLGKLDVPFVKLLLQQRKLTKVRDTYIGGIVKNVSEDGFLRPFFNLHTVVSFRSSADSPNFQNQPIREGEYAKLIRQAFLPRPGHQIGGVDISGAEVRIAACYHQDKEMLAYINDPNKDMHRDMAREIYCLDQNEKVHKQVRYTAKNMFVFPQFYGDWYKSCAQRLWEAIGTLKLERADGMPMREHLKAKRIRSYQGFEDHMQKVEGRFWNDRFRGYTKWKEEWYRRYEKTGKIHMFTGFTCSGVMRKNVVLNLAIQGTAFHCLLWSLIRLHRWLKEGQYETKIIGQIHDEVTMDAHPEELGTVLSRAYQIMTQDIRDAWKFIVVSMDVEAEFAPIDASWWEKKPVEIAK
jgi:DNA polymerase-1